MITGDNYTNFIESIKLGKTLFYIIFYSNLHIIFDKPFKNTYYEFKSFSAITSKCFILILFYILKNYYYIKPKRKIFVYF